MLDWWAVLAVVGGAVLLRRILARAFGDRAPTARIREDDEGNPGDGVSVLDDAGPGESSRDDVDDPSPDSRADGVWIELEIEPLFPSSDAQPQHLVDLTEENESEPTL